MSRIVCITTTVPVMRNGLETGDRQFVVSHGIEEDTGRSITLPSEHPASIGAVLDRQLNEWVLDDQASAAR